MKIEIMNKRKERKEKGITHQSDSASIRSTAALLEGWEEKHNTEKRGAKLNNNQQVAIADSLL